MKIVAYYALHYGREWLHWSMKSIRDFVDEIVVVYTDKPSYGFRTQMPCPEAKEPLVSIASSFGARWFDWDPKAGMHEGTHRDYAVAKCVELGADIVLPIDHDELWEPHHLDKVIEHVATNPERDYRVSMQHFWRSVEWVCRDPLQPVRAIKPSGTGEAYIPPGYGLMHHFGYSQSPIIVNYKWQIHGHQAELRPGWFANTFMGWRPAQFDVHPTNVKFWDAAAFDKASIKHLIGDHPYYNMPIIDNSIPNQFNPEPVNKTWHSIQGNKFGQ